MKACVQFCARLALLLVMPVRLNVRKSVCTRLVSVRSTPSVNCVWYSKTPAMAGVFLWLSLALILAFATCLMILTVCPLERRDCSVQQRYQLNGNGYPQLGRD